MLTRIAAGLMLALLANAAPAQEAATADAAPAAETAPADAELPFADVETAMQHMRGVYAAAGPVFLDLSASTAPRDWMLASQLQMLLDPRDPAHSGKVRAELLRNAAAAAPDDVLVQWMAATAMPGGGQGGCSAPAGLPANMDNLLRLESDNGLAWLPLLRQAYQDKDALGMDAALARMAAAGRFDDHVGEFAQVLTRFHTEHPQLLQAMNKFVQTTGPDIPPPPFDGEISAQAFSVMTATIVASPYSRLLLSVCGGDPQAAPPPARRAICADVAQRLLQLGKSSDLQMAGLRLSRQLGERDAAAEAAAREHQWLVEALSQGADAGSVVNEIAAEVLRSGNELQAVRTIAQSRGVPLTPPPFWQPEDSSGPIGDHATDLDEEAADETDLETEAVADPSAASASDESR